MSQLFKLVWGGKFGTVESWSCSMHGLADDGAGPAPSVVIPLLSTFHSSITTGANPMAFLDFVKLNAVDATDHYVTPNTPVTVDVIPSVAGTGTPGPFQLALCFSLMTAAPRGKASKGRFYLPYAPSSSGIDAIGTVQVGQVQGPLNNAATLMTGLKAAGFAPHVYSVSGATGRPVTRLRVGRVIDTQRRRRRSIPEAYLESGAI